MSFVGSFVPSGNKLSGSSYNYRAQGPHVLSFPGKGFNPWQPSPPSGSTAEWYRSQPATTFTRIEHRKERAGPFFHEFIVVELDNDTVCRFDRRGDPNTRANAFTTEGITAEDTAHVIQKHETHYTEIDETSDLLLQLNLPDGQSIGSILAACYGIQCYETTQAYSLLKHNCYFFSWMILFTVVHDAAGWLIGSGDENFIYGILKLRTPGLKKEKISLGNRISAKTSAIFGSLTTESPKQPQDQSTLITTIRGLDGAAQVSDVIHYIKSRIHNHCKRIRTFGIRLDLEIIEDTIEQCFQKSRR
ncbi:hypothetical protein FRC12_016313 [Ceratobasidium sp. 428]|nr:hypothetical protein FRC12_016313 [Ceratobasidium sp. 428]